MKFEYLDLIREHNVLRDLERQVTIQKTRVEKMKAAFIGKMQLVGTTSYNAPLGTVSLITTDVPQIDDWRALSEYVIATSSLDLLQKRVAVNAWRDRVEQGATVPGINIFTRHSLRIAGASNHD